MDPSGRHGLGTSLLEEILHLVFPDALVTAERLLGAAPECEVARPRSRADIVVWCPELTLVFEAKIDHIERDRQCEDLHEDFRTERGVRFIFLTPDGRDPETAKAVFMPLGMTELREALEAALGRVRPVGAGAATAYSYAETLRREFP
jgi:hypothetical protein